MVEWFERYGWSTNPFEINHLTNLIFGFDDIRKQLLVFIKSGDCCLLVGPSGSGKTLILKWLEGIGTQGTAYVYLNTMGMTENDRKNVNFDKMLRENSGFWPKKKSIVVLVDDTETIPAVLGDSLKVNFENKTIDSIVMATETAELTNVRSSLLGLVGSRIVRMRPMAIEEAMGMIQNRITHINPFEQGCLESIIKKTDMRPRKILEYCELVAKSCNDDIITVDFATKLFEEMTKTPKDVLENLSPLQKEIVMILKTGNFRPVEIAKRLGKPSKTITSQLAYLSLKAGVAIMKRKGLEQPLVEKISEKPVLYKLREI